MHTNISLRREINFDYSPKIEILQKDKQKYLHKLNLRI